MSKLYVPATPGGVLMEELGRSNADSAWRALLHEMGYNQSNNINYDHGDAIASLRLAGWTMEEV